MAPKKKGNKRNEEDWEAELGESVPAATEEDAVKVNGDAEANGEADEMGGGLLAALKKNRSKKAKKGKALDNDFVEGEDPTQADTNGDATAAVDFASKAPQEGTFDDDEEDVFSGKPKKGKASQATQKAPPAAEDEDEGSGKVKSKKEKEKEKKEREKQRKKEQVSEYPT